MSHLQFQQFYVDLTFVVNLDILSHIVSTRDVIAMKWTVFHLKFCFLLPCWTSHWTVKNVQLRNRGVLQMFCIFHWNIFSMNFLISYFYDFHADTFDNSICNIKSIYTMSIVMFDTCCATNLPQLPRNPAAISLSLLHTYNIFFQHSFVESKKLIHSKIAISKQFSCRLISPWTKTVCNLGVSSRGRIVRTILHLFHSTIFPFVINGSLRLHFCITLKASVSLFIRLRIEEVIAHWKSISLHASSARLIRSLALDNSLYSYPTFYLTQKPILTIACIFGIL